MRLWWKAEQVSTQRQCTIGLGTFVESWITWLALIHSTLIIVRSWRTVGAFSRRFVRTERSNVAELVEVSRIIVHKCAWRRRIAVIVIDRAVVACTDWFTPSNRLSASVTGDFFTLFKYLHGLRSIWIPTSSPTRDNRKTTAQVKHFFVGVYKVLTVGEAQEHRHGGHVRRAKQECVVEFHVLFCFLVNCTYCIAL